MTPDLSLLSGFARGVLLSLHVRDTCLHSGSWLLSGFFGCFRRTLRVEVSSGVFVASYMALHSSIPSG